MSYKRISPLPVTDGGTNAQSFTAYSQVCGGTTTTGALQAASTGIGTQGFVLTSTGSSSLPQWKTSIANSTVGSSNNTIISSTSAANFIAIPTSASPAINATESNVQVVIPYNCTAQNLYAVISANSSTANLTLKLRQNGNDTTLTTTITASSAGTFSDTSHSVSLSAGDLINFSISQATTGNATGSITMQLVG